MDNRGGSIFVGSLSSEFVTLTFNTPTYVIFFTHYDRRGEAPCFDLGVQMSAGSNQNPGNICCY